MQRAPRRRWLPIWPGSDTNRLSLQLHRDGLACRHAGCGRRMFLGIGLDNKRCHHQQAAEKSCQGDAQGRAAVICSGREKNVVTG